MDMSKTVAPKSDQINADDMIGGPITITVTRVTGNEGNAEQPVNIWFAGDNGKPYRPCKSMRRVLLAVWGPDASIYEGRSMTLYRDPSVRFGGMEVGGIRISHMTDIERPVVLALTASKAKRAPYTVKPLAKPSAPTKESEAILAFAEMAAAGGMAAFTAFWNSPDGKAGRDVIRPHMDRIKEIALAADALAQDAASFESGGNE